jgi:hypothetical protein
MSGGRIKKQGKGEHQVAIFTFAGALTQTEVNAWNNALLAVKDELGPKVMGITIEGLPSWPSGLKKRKARR